MDVPLTLLSRREGLVQGARLHGVLYLGGLRLAGGQVDTPTRRRLERRVGELEWERLALTEAQSRDDDLARLAIRRSVGKSGHKRVPKSLRSRHLPGLHALRLDLTLAAPAANSSYWPRSPVSTGLKLLTSMRRDAVHPGNLSGRADEDCVGRLSMAF